MKAEILKINCGLFHVFPEVGLLGARKHCPIGSAREILNVISKSDHWTSKRIKQRIKWKYSRGTNSALDYRSSNCTTLVSLPCS